MELKDYIRGVISQISEAVDEINLSSGQELSKVISCPIVNPTFSDISDYQGRLFCVLEQEVSIGEPSYIKPIAFCKVVDVDFDVTLTTSSKSEKGGKLDVRVAGFGASKGDETSASNRVKFSLPVLFPSINQPFTKQVF